MLVEKVGEKEFRLHHVTGRVKNDTVLIFIPMKGKVISEELKKEGVKSGAYCILRFWTRDGKRCFVRTSPPVFVCDVLVKKAELVHFYPADKYRLWREMIHRSLLKACHEELAILRR